MKTSPTQSRQIRVLPLEIKSGVENMAVDLAMVDCCHRIQQPTLRFYQWNEPTLSLGYFQAYEDRLEHTTSAECACVRRSTGGGAILHQHELTYSWVAPSTSDKEAETRLYEQFHESLIRALARFGIQSSLADEERNTDAFFCFSRRTSLDVVCDGHKIAGSAQRRKKGIVLQHGSVLLNVSPFAPQLLGIAQLARSIGPEQLAEAWQADLASGLSWQLKTGHLTSLEVSSAERIGNEIGAVSYVQKR